MKLNFNKYLSTIYISIFKIFPVSFNRSLSKFFKKLHDLNLKSSYGSDFISELDIENTKFKLWLMKNDNQAQSVYQPLHKKKISYETVMIKTMIAVIKRLESSALPGTFVRGIFNQSGSSIGPSYSSAIPMQ